MPRRNHESRNDALQISQDLVLRQLRGFLVGVRGSSRRDAYAGQLNLQVNQPCCEAMLGIRLSTSRKSPSMTVMNCLPLFCFLDKKDRYMENLKKRRFNSKAPDNTSSKYSFPWCKLPRKDL